VSHDLRGGWFEEVYVLGKEGLAAAEGDEAAIAASKGKGNSKAGESTGEAEMSEEQKQLMMEETWESCRIVWERAYYGAVGILMKWAVVVMEEKAKNEKMGGSEGVVLNARGETEAAACAETERKALVDHKAELDRKMLAARTRFEETTKILGVDAMRIWAEWDALHKPQGTPVQAHAPNAIDMGVVNDKYSGIDIGTGTTAGSWSIVPAHASPTPAFHFASHDASTTTATQALNDTTQTHASPYAPPPEPGWWRTPSPPPTPALSPQNHTDHSPEPDPSIRTPALFESRSCFASHQPGSANDAENCKLRSYLHPKDQEPPTLSAALRTDTSPAPRHESSTSTTTAPRQPTTSPTSAATAPAPTKLLATDAPTAKHLEAGNDKDDKDGQAAEEQEEQGTLTRTLLQRKRPGAKRKVRWEMEYKAKKEAYGW
jgi:hypothetical protein